MSEFREDLEHLINRHSMENGSDTPDWILADYLAGCLSLFDATTKARDRWYEPETVQQRRRGGSEPQPPPPAAPAAAGGKAPAPELLDALREQAGLKTRAAQPAAAGAGGGAVKRYTVGIFAGGGASEKPLAYVRSYAYFPSGSHCQHVAYGENAREAKQRAMRAHKRGEGCTPTGTVW